MSATIQTRPSLEVAISVADTERVGRLLAGSRSEETRRSYTAALKIFCTWCEQQGYPDLPSTPVVIAAYVAYRAEHVAHVTIARDLAAIAAAHLDSGLEDPTRHHGVRQALRSVGRTRGTAPIRRAAPVTTDAMRRIVGAMEDRDHAAGARDAAILLLGLAAAMRRRELAALTTSDLTPRSDGLVMRIRSSKTDQTGKGEVVGIPYGTNPDTCPVRAITTWLEISRRTLGDGAPLFSRIYSHARIGAHPLADRSIARIIQQRAADAGVTGEDYVVMFSGDTWVSGHSLRAGHATAAAENGADPTTIARTTRHKRLESLTKYIRPLNAVSDSTAGRIGL